MNIPKKKCAHCKRWFKPDARVWKQQKRCFREECRKAANRRKQRKWIKLHPDYLEGRRAKASAWAKSYPNYWQGYRKTHPAYVKRDNKRRKVALRKQKRSAKLTSIRKIAVGKLRGIQGMGTANCSAKLTSIDRRMARLLDYLLWTVGEPCSAKQTHMVIPSPSAP